ncbi:MAG: UDP-N-acetylmuramoyl-tripeptide--D-alanyl-D-alanine ligase, partial [Gemmatimonadetes bacterium]|nr:UDP-N-acetylmuramoyl-tripeptide--D-alanyl-D-alanine ligase [Gemmatimonadota bacterium]NIS30324.1 UDP-N-acetylmuramoyl-tripeptide--D-alanyl-D-alanine ligase [Actinomycetota bacterium]NIU65554.1 UDP-N-acetylmuramoyl-tripeptide--D-alanyl-D-alanine ligase [Actinomycetota bacterium]NIW27370.1 UDP-N-acetylmuramoyl-tripeptide--D-alanyl-D-alanine ligase [Actinomycetota bacterium]NIX19897.1 UDP-N-acetylmuramoyl-tripeptide--D-alanyl-D-alanine ligase [Actinomycetota bacterium]
MRRLAIGTGVLAGGALAVLRVWLPEAAGLVPLAMPLLVDLAASLLAPVEGRMANRWVRQASDRLAEVAPTVVAITGSYGKTTTKGYVAHLLG